MEQPTKRTWAEISLPALSHNYHAIRSVLPDDCRFLGVVKADAYGHGALRVAELLQREGADYLAVSCLDEALELRKGGITMPILILGHTPVEYTAVLLENGLTQTATCLAKAEEYSEEAGRLGRTLKLHIKLDTGMSRLGYLCADSQTVAIVISPVVKIPVTHLVYHGAEVSAGLVGVLEYSGKAERVCRSDAEYRPLALVAGHVMGYGLVYKRHSR